MKLSCFPWAEPARVLRHLLAGLALASLLIPQSTPASGVVTNCTDADLRAALAGGGTVTFDCDGTITLTNTLTIATNTTLDASGRSVVLSGNNVLRPFAVNAGVQFTLNKLTVANGRHPTEGSGIFNEGALTLWRCTLSNNVVCCETTTRGGAVLNSGTLEAIECTFVTNRVDTGSTYGGAINNAGVLRVERCAFLHSGSSGAILNWVSTPGDLRVGITNSTFFGGAGGVYHLSGGTSVQGQTYIVNCTFAGGTGAAVDGLGFPLPWVANSIVGYCQPGFCSFADGGNNLISAGGPGAIDPRLGPLTNNGGSTLTMAPMPDSPAINQGNNAICPPTDQRGVARPFGPACDIGAYEATVPPSPSFLQFSAGAFTTSENEGAATITVTRTGSSAGAVSVQYATSNGTALAGSDYASASGVLNFANGQTSANIVISIQNDLVPESDETFHLALSAPSGGPALGSPAEAVLTIHDDDPASPGTLQFSSETYSVSESDGEAILTVLRTGGTNGLVSAEFYVAGGTATASDYVAATGTVVLQDTEVRKSVAFRIVPDAVHEGPETVVLGLRNPTGGAAVSSAKTTLSILDANQTVGDCNELSLRAAMAGGGKITLDCDGPIILTSPLVVSNGVSLDAASHNVSLSGSNATRLFVVMPGVTLTLRRLALVNGLARGTDGGLGQPGESAQGGAVCNSNGVLNAYDCTFEAHRAQGGSGGGGGFPFPAPGNGGVAAGGAIYNWLGSVNASNCLFLSNRAEGGNAGSGQGGFGLGGESRGGALCNVSGSVHLAWAILSNNVALAGQHRRFGSTVGSAPASGGAFCNVGDAGMFSSRLLGNFAISEYTNTARGGAISHQSQGVLSLTDCAVSENRALAGAGFFGLQSAPGGPALGGGLDVAAGEARLTNTVLFNNLALGGDGALYFVDAGPGLGGGLYNTSAARLVNCTVAHNVARGGPSQRLFPLLSGNGEGGGLYNTSGGSMFLTHVTVAANAAEAGAYGNPPGQARGGAIASEGGSVMLRNTILAHSLSASNCFGTGILDQGHNISSDASCNFTAPGSLNKTDPLLGPLADYGGPTPTMALLAGSPALDAADPAFCPATDQRGIARPFGAGCDIGAFESAPPYTILGQVHGFTTPASGIQLTSPSGSTNLPPSGQFAVRGLASGTHLLSVSSPECVFVPRTLSLTVGPDIVDAGFFSYRTNALFIERLSPDQVRWAYAGEAGAIYHVLSGTDVTSLTLTSTNQAQANGLIEFTLGTAGASERFFQVVRP
jgi:hypothetical protein